MTLLQLLTQCLVLCLVGGAAWITTFTATHILKSVRKESKVSFKVCSDFLMVLMCLSVASCTLDCNIDA